MRAVARILLSSVLLTAGISLAAAQPKDADLLKEAQEYFKPVPSIIPSIKGNAITRVKIELGKKLYFDPRLSRSGFISCNSCHNVGMGGGDNLETSVGHGWKTGPRNAPTVLNAVFNTAQFWDGRAEDLRTQAKGPIQAGVEMANTPDRVIATLMSMPEYVAEFKISFPGEADPVTFDNVAKAIEAFEATLITPASRFDQFLEGNAEAMTKEEKVGLSIFIDKGCISCHTGVNIGGDGYFPFGLIEKPEGHILPSGDKGRFEVTQTEDEAYSFRAAPLRNIALTAPYFHSGKVWTLEEAVAVMGTAQLGEKLSKAEIGSLVAFLKTLTGEQPDVKYPILPASTDTTPKPEMVLPGEEPKVEEVKAEEPKKEAPKKK